MQEIITGAVLVCVTDQPSCHRLITAGKAIAERYALPLKVVSVLPPRLVSEKTAEALQTLHNISSKQGADMTVFFNESPAITIAVHARQCDAVHLVMGTPGAESTMFIETLRELLPEIPLSLVDTDGQIITFPALSPTSNAKA